MPEKNRHAASFRDPSGHIFVEHDVLFRRVNPVYLQTYRGLSDSGFYAKLIENKLLVPHDEISADSQGAVVKPEKIPFFSYPYEWSFTQYKHAALHTLKLQKYCLENGWTLKDATAFNITFHNGWPIFVDTLSFDPYVENQPWRAYRQFLTHFLSPLVLARFYGNDMLKLLQQYIDGVPLDKTAAMLPVRARFSPILYANIFLAAKYDKAGGSEKAAELSKKAQIRLLDSLYHYIKDLRLSEKTQWDDYYAMANYEKNALEFKKELVSEWLAATTSKRFIDLGGNDGTFSRVFKSEASEILVMDIDPNAVDQNYRQVLKNSEQNILPIVCDLLNPAPGIGFANQERTAVLQRIKAGSYDATLALALIHHLSLSGNVPFEMSAALFASLTPYLIIEFPDRGDSWVQFLLKSKREFEGHFDHYTIANFEASYLQLFDMLEKIQIPDSQRTMYLLKRKN